MTVDVDAQTGAFSISVAGRVWLQGAEIAVNSANSWASNLNKGLTMMESGQQFSGADSTGAFTATRFTFSLGGAASDPTMVATVRVYTDVSAVAFEQFFPQGVEDTSVWNTTKVISSFPTFELSGAADEALGYASFWGQFVQHVHVGQWWNGTWDAACYCCCCCCCCCYCYSLCSLLACRFACLFCDGTWVWCVRVDVQAPKIFHLDWTQVPTRCLMTPCRTPWWSLH